MYKIILIIFILLLPVVALAQQQCDPTKPSSALCNPVPANDLPAFIGLFINYFGVSLGGAAVLMMVIGGLQLIASQGDSEAIEKGKTTVTWTVLGFIVSILAYVIVAASQKLVGARPVPQTQIDRPAYMPFRPTEAFTTVEFMASFFQNLFAIAGVLALFMLIVSGVRYITAGGNDEQVNQGKQGITWSLAGLFVILFGYVIISAAAAFFKR